MTKHAEVDRRMGEHLAAALHVSNGDATDLAGTGLARQIRYWRDSLHEGPVPAVAAAQLRPIRAAFLTQAGRPFERRLPTGWPASPPPGPVSCGSWARRSTVSAASTPRPETACP